MQNRSFPLLALLLLAFLPDRSLALAWTEVGDAGELLTTAQQPVGGGALDSISGTLSSEFDVDLYEIVISTPATFSVTVTANLTVDNDAQLFLFDSSGLLALSDDDDGVGLLPQFNAGELAGASAGTYFLAFDVFNNDPSGDPLTGWNKSPSPAQSGTYTLALTGVQAVPEPGTAALIGAGLAMLGLSRRGRRPGRTSAAPSVYGRS